MKKSSPRLGLGQKVALEHTAKTTANGRPAPTLRASVTGQISPYQQGAVVCIRPSERDSGRLRTVDTYGTHVEQAEQFRDIATSNREFEKIMI